MVMIENKEVKEALYELSIQTNKQNVYQDELNGQVNTIQNYNDKDELYWLPLYGLFDEDKDGC